MAKKDISQRNPITRWEIRAKNSNLFTPNNKVVICGIVEEDLKYNHREKGERLTFYRTRIICMRKDGKIDYVPILIPKNLIETLNIKNKWIEAAGILRTYRDTAEDGHRYLNVNVLISEYHIYDNKGDMKEKSTENIVYIDGYLCKDSYSMYGIKADILVIINSKGKKGEACVPCIVWGKALEDVLKLKAGSHLSFFGRFQSKQYVKKISESIIEKRTAYEIATNSVRILEEK